MTALRLLVALPLVSLAACVPAPAPTPAPSPTVSQPQPSHAPQQLVTPTYDNWMDVPQTAGDWFYSAVPPYTYAAFGPAASQPLASIRCDRTNRTISIARSSAAPASRPMTIRTETGDRTYAAAPRLGSADQMLAVDLPAQDPFFDAIAFSRGRFALEVMGEPALYLPAWPEISRVIDDCR